VVEEAVDRLFEYDAHFIAEAAADDLSRTVERIREDNPAAAQRTARRSISEL
jgi:hypothetical protein